MSGPFLWRQMDTSCQKAYSEFLLKTHLSLHLLHAQRAVQKAPSGADFRNSSLTPRPIVPEKHTEGQWLRLLFSILGLQLGGTDLAQYFLKEGTMPRGIGMLAH